MAISTMEWSTWKFVFQSIGIVYGDIGTAPLYTISGAFPNGIRHQDDILGVLGMIIYALSLITMVKYVFIILSANDNGDGGTFALYSFLCRHVNVGLIPAAEDNVVSINVVRTPYWPLNRAVVKSVLEKSHFAKCLLLFITMLGTSMVIGDGILTPCISVLSAVGGIKKAARSLDEAAVMWISVVILLILFQLQRFGTDKIGYFFAPILTIWFILISVIGMYNFVVHDPSVIKAINPVYIVEYFIRNKMDAWISLGGIILCITGSEALFADLGHFSVQSIRISSCTIVFPSIILAYLGQASYLRKHILDVDDVFYKSVPGNLYWPVFLLAVLAAVIASQSMISACYSIVQQALAFRCFPRVKVIHTSDLHKGQVYVPQINNLLMLACIGVTLGFRNTLTIGNAYGISVLFVMSLTSLILVLVMIIIWKTNICLIIAYVLLIMSFELVCLIATFYKFASGGYLPLVFAVFLTFIMYTWNYVYRMKYMYELENKVTTEKLMDAASGIVRLPGIAMFYSDDQVHGISPILTHCMTNLPALHSVILFFSVKSLPISNVHEEVRFIFSRIEPYEMFIFQCVARYGYRDVPNENDLSEDILLLKFKDFIMNDDEGGANIDVESQIISSSEESTIVHLIIENEITTSVGSSLGKRLMIDYAYNFLARCLRQEEQDMLGIPRKRLLKVGMIYEL